MRKLGLYLLCTVLAVIFLLPFLIMLSGAVQKMNYFDPSRLIPLEFSLDNFVYLFDRGKFARWLANSVWITVIPVISQILLCSMLGYLFAKKTFFGKEALFWTMMGMIMIPKQLLIIPNYLLFSWLDWIDTLTPLIVPEMWSIFGVFLVRQYFQTVPDDFEEAAAMEGAGDFRIFFTILFPMAIPAIATVGTFTFISHWNDLFSPLIFTVSEDNYPLTVGLSTLMVLDSIPNFGYQMAGAAISFVPTFLIFLFFQRYFIAGITMSGLK